MKKKSTFLEEESNHHWMERETLDFFENKGWLNKSIEDIDIFENIDIIADTGTFLILIEIKPFIISKNTILHFFSLVSQILDLLPPELKNRTILPLLITNQEIDRQIEDFSNDLNIEICSIISKNGATKECLEEKIKEFINPEIKKSRLHKEGLELYKQDKIEAARKRLNIAHKIDPADSKISDLIRQIDVELEILQDPIQSTKLEKVKGISVSKESKEEVFSVSIVSLMGLFFLMMWIGLFPSVLVGYWLFLMFPFSFSPLYLLLMIPLFLLLYGVALLSSLFSTKISIWLIHKRLTPPIPGSYPLKMENPHTRAFVFKQIIKNFGRWLYCFFHLRFLRAFWMRQMGVKIGKNVKLGIHTQDENFIEFGDNTFCADQSYFAGHLSDQTILTITRTIIGKNCVFENVSGSLGGKIGGNSIFLHVSGAMKGQICRGNAIYLGIPCKKIDNNNLTPEQVEELKEKIRKIDKTDFIKLKNAPIKTNEKKLFLIKVIIIMGACLFGLFFPALYIIFFRSVYILGNHLFNILVLTLVPIVFYISIGFFIFGALLFVKIFLMYYDRKAEIPEGTYELDDPRTKIFKIKYFLRLFGLRLIHGTIFRFVDTLAMRFWGNVKLGANVKIDEAIVDPQYLEIGDNSQIAAGARVHTHDIINGKLYIKKVILGKNLIISSYAHVKPGVQIADGSIVAVAAWMRKNRKCKRPALWIGKPAIELPLDLGTKAARIEGRYVD